MCFDMNARRDGCDALPTFFDNRVLLGLFFGFAGVVSRLIQLLLEAQLAAFVRDLRLRRELAVGFGGHDGWLC